VELPIEKETCHNPSVLLEDRTIRSESQFWKKGSFVHKTSKPSNNVLRRLTKSRFFHKTPFLNPEHVAHVVYHAIILKEENPKGYEVRGATYDKYQVPALQ
jgi:hypothetical protein